MSSKTIDLLDSLETKLVVFFDDTCIPTDDANEIFTNLIKLPETQQQFVLTKFFNTESESFQKFKDWIYARENPDFFLAHLKRNTHQEYLTKHDGSMFDEFIKTILIKIQKPEILLNLKLFGVALTLPSAFNPFFESIIDNRIYVIYKDALDTQVLEEIKVLRTLIESNFILFILDKAGQDNGNEGYEFIKEHLDSARKNENFKYISMLLTSQPKNDSTNEAIDFFRKELEKNSPTLMDSVEESLLLAAYAYFILQFEKYYTESIVEARNFSLKNYKNFANVLKDGHSEGIAPFEAMTDWLNIILDFNTHKRAIEDYINIFGLTSFFEKNLLNDIPTAQPDFDTIKDQYQEIRSSELFDFNVNKKYLPPAPGDIFFNATTECYQVLLGQACDMSMRYEEDDTSGKACRKIKVAQMLPAKFVTAKQMEKKCEIKHLQIILRDFKNNEASIGNLEINVNEQITADFDIIDCCMFNDMGMCQVSLEQELSISITKVLPLGKEANYSTLQNKARQKLEVINALKATDDIYKNFERLIVEHIDYSTFKFNYDEANKTLVYPLQRVARIKKSFFNLIYKKFIDHQGRIDLNLLNTVSENTKSYPVEIQLTSKKYKDTGHILNVYSQDDGIYISLDELKTYLNDFELLNSLSFESSIKLEDNKVTCETTETVLEIKDGKLLIKLPLLLPDGKFHNNHEVPLKKLIGDFIEQTTIYVVNGNAEEQAIDKVKTKLSIFDHIEKGIIFPEIKKQMTLINGQVIMSDLV